MISGYLITQVLQESSDLSVRHWLAEFYLRRCRRVLPALLAMLLLVTPIAALVLLPADLRSYGRYLSFTSVLLTNVAAWSDHAGGRPALIHLWTIAVEEQFYLLFPLVLLGAWKTHGIRPALLIGAIAAVSFALSVWASYAKPTASFYLTPPRVWELLLGALLALTRWRIQSRMARELVAATSLLVIAVTVNVYSSRTPYAGLYALPVCLAAAGLLASGRDRGTRVARLLSIRPLVFTGLISYSLYLWQAPILALIWTRNRANPDTAWLVCALAGIWVLAAGSWRFVEQPIRRGTWPGSSRRFLIAAAALNLALGTVGILLWKAL